MRIWLKNLREKNHLDMEEMAVALGIDKKYYKSLEEDGIAFLGNEIPVLVAAKISECFNIPISQLILLENGRKRGTQNEQKETGVI